MLTFLIGDSRTGKPLRINALSLDQVSVKYFKVPKLFDTYIERERKTRKKSSVADELKVKEKHLSNTGSDRGAETRSMLGIFFRFVDTEVKPVVVDLRHLLDVRVAAAFPRWYESTGKSASTIANCLKIIRMFLKYLHVSNYLWPWRVI